MSETEVKYSAMGPESLDEIRELWEKLNLLHSTLSPHFGNLARLRTFEARKNELQEKSMTGWLRVDLARDAASGQVIGYAVATLSQAGTGEIDSIFVEEAFRGKGVGERLMKRALSWLDECGAKMKSIAVATGNERVFGFYQRFGFYPITTTLMQSDFLPNP
jgi:diamine N-acetyltransferase